MRKCSVGGVARRPSGIHRVDARLSKGMALSKVQWPGDSTSMTLESMALEPMMRPSWSELMIRRDQFERFMNKVQNDLS